MKTLSVTLATYNEEANLARCLAAVKDLASEIIIVDGTSADRTVAIAKDFGAKVTVTTNKPIFHINKQMANDKARGDWILQLDGDEIVTGQLKKEIKLLLADKAYGVDGWVSPIKRLLGRRTRPLLAPAAAYYLPRKNFFLGRYLKHAGQYPDPVIRLFQKGKAYLPAKDVHEQMVVNGSIGWLTGELDHYATPDFSRYLVRENRYSSLAAVQLKATGVKVSPMNTLNYLFVKPAATFLSLYLRHRGFLDGFPGFVFSLYSGLHHAFAYMKLWELYKNAKD
ncbi:MAG: glycosyltransferase family 2 protein [Microgenomates group bacterium]